MTHIKRHANTVGQTVDSVQCRYCLLNVGGQSILDDHLSEKHPLETKANHEYYCVICWVSTLHIYCVHQQVKLKQTNNE